MLNPRPGAIPGSPGPLCLHHHWHTGTIIALMSQWRREVTVDTPRRIPQAVVRELGYYVYLYVHPETRQVFYVGKGRGNRALSHIHAKSETPHHRIIRDLHRRGLQPEVQFLIHGLKDERTALDVEMAAIDLLGLEKLTNVVGGHSHRYRSRMSLEQVLALYQRKPVRITEPAVLIRIARNYHYGMSPVELYDATRSSWKVGSRRREPRYAIAVFAGVVREVYRITEWLPSGSTLRHDRPHGDTRRDRWEFVGVVAEDAIRTRYLNQLVSHYFAKHSRNPVRYVNC